MFCYTAGTAVVSLAVYEFWFLAQILYWVEHNPTTTRVMDARLEALRQNKPRAALDQKWADYERISIHLKRAIIIAEDAKFVDHEGFDWEGIQRAMDKNQRRGKFVAGARPSPSRSLRTCFFRASAVCCARARRRFLPRCSRPPWTSGAFSKSI